jgi:hypothetical protein
MTDRCCWTMSADLKMRRPWIVSWFTERVGPSDTRIIARLRWIPLRPI